MRPTAAVLSVISLACALLAQGPLPSPIRPVAAPFAVQSTAMLRPAADGDGLFGMGAAYAVHLTKAGMRFDPASGRDGATPRLVLSPLSVRRGEVDVAQLPSGASPVQADRTAHYEHAPGVTERYDVRPEGVALSWVFAQPPAGAGDLVVRYAVDTSLPPPTADDTNGGLAFVATGANGERLGGVAIGGVTGIDARGARTAGALRYVDGGLELSLPAAFVAAATYPLVLDPLIGTPFGVWTQHAATDQDLAYDAATDRFLVVWTMVVGGVTYVCGQLVHNGLVFGLITFGTSGTPSHVRVANDATRGQFGIVWTEQQGSTSRVMFETLDASSGVITHSVTLATSTAGTHVHADIGCESNAPLGTSRGFVIVWEDNGLDAIRAQRLWFGATGTIGLAPPMSVFTDTMFGTVYRKPAIARAAANDGKLLVVAQRSTPAIGASAIVGAVVTTNAAPLGPTVTIHDDANDDVDVPDVDGFASEWVVAWQRDQAGASTTPSVLVAKVALAGATLTVGPSTTFGTAFAQISNPSVGHGLAKTWLGYRSVTTFPGTNVQLRIAGIDSDSCNTCNDTFPVGSVNERVVAATATSGGAPGRERALAVWLHTFGGVIAQYLENHGSGGATADLGGGCGTGGTPAFSQAPSIGCNGLTCSVTGLPATTLATIFNFSAPGATVPCGACVWTPFAVTQSPPLVGGSASVTFAIPCVSSLVGAQFETQWTSVDLTAAPCPLLPGFVLSPRTLLTIGP